MASYHFTYFNAGGGVVRVTAIQCESDDEAIGKARDTMMDRYAVMKIMAGEREIQFKTTASC